MPENKTILEEIKGFEIKEVAISVKRLVTTES